MPKSCKGSRLMSLENRVNAASQPYQTNIDEQSLTRAFSGSDAGTDKIRQEPRTHAGAREVVQRTACQRPQLHPSLPPSMMTPLFSSPLRACLVFDVGSWKGAHPPRMPFQGSAAFRAEIVISSPLIVGINIIIVIKSSTSNSNNDNRNFHR